MILGDYSVDEAYIIFGTEVIPLACVWEKRNLWKFSLLVEGDPIKDRLKYKYGFKSKGHDFKLPLIGRIGIFSKDPSYCEEASEKRVESQVQFDVFHFPDDRFYLSETRPQSVVFYVQWLMGFVYPPTISEILIQIEGLRFDLLCIKHVKHSVNWILEQASGNSVTDVQRLYLCIVLSHIDKHYPYTLPIPTNSQITEAFDRLLQCLNTCVYSNFLSPSNLKSLQKIAITLVQNCSSPGWLTLAAYFYPYLGIQFLIEKKHAIGLNYRYDRKEYHKRVNELLFNIKIKNSDDQLVHQKLLHFMLKCAPTLDETFDLFENYDVPQFFDTEEKKVDFFVKFYQDQQRGYSTQSKSSGAKLIEFFKIPEKMRGRLYNLLYSILLEYAKSDEELKNEHVKIFLHSVISNKDLDMPRVLEILKELSKSKSIPRQDLLLKILSNNLFEQDWHGTLHDEKVKICTSWVTTRVTNKNARNDGGSEGTAAVYEAMNAIMQCSLNIANETLAKKVFTKVVEKMLRNEDTISVLKASASIEKCVAVVQECYKSHVRNILRQTPGVVRKSSKFLEEISSSSKYAFIYIIYK